MISHLGKQHDAADQFKALVALSGKRRSQGGTMQPDTSPTEREGQPSPKFPVLEFGGGQGGGKIRGLARMSED